MKQKVKRRIIEILMVVMFICITFTISVAALGGVTTLIEIVI